MESDDRTLEIPLADCRGLVYEYDHGDQPTIDFDHNQAIITMPSSVGAPQTHGQRSRKGKKAWRKNVDVSEIQEGLEYAREEVTKG